MADMYYKENQGIMNYRSKWLTFVLQLYPGQEYDFFLIFAYSYRLSVHCYFDLKASDKFLVGNEIILPNNYEIPPCRTKLWDR